MTDGRKSDLLVGSKVYGRYVMKNLIGSVIVVPDPRSSLVLGALPLLVGSHNI